MSSGTTEDFMHSPRHRAGMQVDRVAFSKLDHFASERVLFPPRGTRGVVWHAMRGSRPAKTVPDLSPSEQNR